MKVSIITINFNNLAGLQQTIDSVVSQSCRDFEWIVIDGGSSDGSRELIERFADYFSYWVSELDGGVYDAMNKGIEVATGEYCLFLNSGDAFTNRDVLKEVLGINDWPELMAGQVKDSSGRVITPPPILNFRFLYSNNIPHQGEFIRRDLFDRLGRYSMDLRILSDYEFNLKASFNSISYRVIPIVVSIVEPGGISMTMVDRVNAERQIIFNRLLPKSILEDYLYWLNPTSFSHPAVCWLVKKPRLMKFLNAVFKRFSRWRSL